MAYTRGDALGVYYYLQAKFVFTIKEFGILKVMLFPSKEEVAIFKTDTGRSEHTWLNIYMTWKGVMHKNLCL